MTHLNGQLFYDRWRECHAPEEFESWLDEIERGLAMVTGDRCVLLLK